MPALANPLVHRRDFGKRHAAAGREGNLHIRPDCPGVAAQLARNGVRTEAIHGGRSQNQRDRALANFKAGKVDALVATDVAARGIHVDDVACVVHFDPAADDKDYLHRSGRTGRAGASGTVITLMGPQAKPAPKAKPPRARRGKVFATNRRARAS